MRTNINMRVWAPVLLLSLAVGCIQVKDELTVQADGSGTVVIETKVLAPMDMMGGPQDFRGMMGMGRGPGIAPYPPINKEMAEELFPTNDFVVSFKDSSPKSASNHVA